MTLLKTSTTNLRIAISIMLMVFLWSPFAFAVEQQESTAIECADFSLSNYVTENCEQHDHNNDCEECSQSECTQCALFGCGVCQLSLVEHDGALHLPLSSIESSGPLQRDVWAFPNDLNGLFRPPRA